MLLPTMVHAQDAAPTLFLRPHCEEEDQTLCDTFEASDPSTLVTPTLERGALLDLDLVLSNPTEESIAKLRVWLSYDADALNGMTMTLSPFFPDIVPGETDFTPLSGYAKIAASAVAGAEPSTAILPVARLVFTVKEDASASATPLSFYDQRSGTQGHTFVSTVSAPDQNLLSDPLGTLIVQLAAPEQATASSANAASASSTYTASASSASMPATDSQGSFTQIQMQNLRVGTKDDRLYATWDLLNHPRLQGYNLYFGTIKGQYLQRRSVSVASRGTVISGLPAGKTYFVSVRGVDDENQETAFSNEAMVEIGNATSASPAITGSLSDIGVATPADTAPRNPIEDPRRPLESGVPGKSGSSSALLLLLLGSAVIGTLLAFRRQMTAESSPRP